MTDYRIPEGHSFELSDIDAFSVDEQAPLWKSISMFILLLPATIIPLILTLLVAGFFLPIYPKLPLSIRLRVGRMLAIGLLISARLKLNIRDCNPSEDAHSKLYVAPHISMMESAIFIRLLGHFRPIAAAFAKTIPIFGYFVKAIEPIYIERKKGSGRGAVDLLRLSLEETEYKHLVFPEGTYTNGHSIIKFKSGAFAVGYPVTPVICDFPVYTPFWNRKESSFLVQLFRITSRLITAVDITILPTYIPSEEELADPKLYAEHVRRLISYHSGRPLSKQALQDSPNFQKDVK
jgi:lysophosphatidylcholine acyltransferase/lyso-PAF acetyltransferase